MLPLDRESALASKGTALKSRKKKTAVCCGWCYSKGQGSGFAKARQATKDGSNESKLDVLKRRKSMGRSALKTEGDGGIKKM